MDVIATNYTKIMLRAMMQTRVLVIAFMDVLILNCITNSGTFNACDDASCNYCVYGYTDPSLLTTTQQLPVMMVLVYHLHSDVWIL